MSANLAFLELRFGKLKEIDLHGLTKEEVKSQIYYVLNSIDVFYNGVLLTHGYHSGTVLKNFIREELQHPNIVKKVSVDASRTILLLKLEK